MSSMVLARRAADHLLWLAALCFLAGAGATLADVALRWLLQLNIPGVIEITTFAIGLGALLSIPVCFLERSHIAAKLLSEARPHIFSRPLGALGALLSVVFAFFLAWIMGRNALEKLGSPETTPDLGLPMGVLLMVVAGAVGIAALAAIFAMFIVPRESESADG